MANIMLLGIRQGNVRPTSAEALRSGIVRHVVTGIRLLGLELGRGSDRWWSCRADAPDLMI